MKKLIRILFVCAFLVGIIGCQPFLPALSSGNIPLPKIDRRPPAANWGRGNLSRVPVYDPNKNDTWQMDLRSYNLSDLDLTKSLNDLMYADFDTLTQWPSADKMPSGFDAQKILELGKNPGLGIRSLHANGIDGRNVGIAIIDLPMLVDHQEYSDRLKLYEEINIGSGSQSEMHGPAVASIAVGKNTGVAPQADLYFIACYPGDFGKGSTSNFTYDFHNMALAVHRILDINQGLPVGHKIRVISISVGWESDQKGYDEMNAAVKQAKDSGILVVSSSIEETFGLKFHGLGRVPYADPDKFESYEPGAFWANSFYSENQFSDRLLVPMDSRTLASPGGSAEYVFYRQGGWSWSIPYLAGVYALAAQVQPKITPTTFWAAAMKTGRTIDLSHANQTIHFGPILDPAALMNEIKTN